MYPPKESLITNPTYHDGGHSSWLKKLFILLSGDFKATCITDWMIKRSIKQLPPLLPPSLPLPFPSSPSPPSSFPPQSQRVRHRGEQTKSWSLIIVPLPYALLPGTRLHRKVEFCNGRNGLWQIARPLKHFLVIDCLLATPSFMASAVPLCQQLIRSNYCLRKVLF